MGEAEHADALVGQIIASRYLIEARLGHGAMGTVYRARHIKVGRAFAIKVLHPELLADPKLGKRFDREAELAGTLRHPNVVGVVDVGETPDGLRYLVMELAEGKTLFELIYETAPMPAPRVISLARQLADGLHHAHERGMIHRDFKPENVIVECDRHGTETPRILDFGIAILRDDADSDKDRLTTAGLVLGTPHYMAPEHATGERIDHRIDLFALGVICYEMITGQMPFDGNGVEVARANLLRDTPAMGVRVPHVAVDPLLEAFTRKLMMKVRDERPVSALAARQLLDLIERDRPAAAAALGVKLPAASPPPVPRIRTGGARLASVAGGAPLAVVSHAAPVPPILELAPTAMIDIPSPRGTTQLDVIEEPLPTELTLVRPRRKLAAVLALLVAAVAAVGIVVATRTPASEAAAPPPPPVTVTEPARAVAEPPHAVAEPPHAVAESPPLAPPPAPAVTVKPAVGKHPASKQHVEARSAPAAHEPPVETAHAPPAVAKQVDPPKQETPMPVFVAEPMQLTETPTPSTVAVLYASVGRELKRLDQARGSAATADLWPLYLRVRINDVIADHVKLAEANTLLGRLHHEIADRAR